MKLLPASTHAAFIGSVPDALRPSWLLDTWTGTFGSKGLRASTDSADMTVHLGRDFISGEGHVAGSVRDMWHEVGSFSRRPKLHTSGRLSIDHSYLALGSRAQGSGFARGFNDHAFRRYSQANVDDVTVHAALDIGGYAWARQGFELAVDGASEAAPQVQRAWRVRDLVQRALNEQMITGPEFLGISRHLIGFDERITPATITGVQQLAQHPLGRSILLGSNWEGVRRIAHSGNWWDDLTGPTTDALTGVSLLHRSGDRGMAGRVARRAASRLPAAFDPSTVAHALEQRTKGQVRAAVTRVELAGPDDLIRDVAARYELHTTMGTHHFDVARGRWLGTTVREHGASTHPQLREALDLTWADLDARVTRRT